MVFRYSFCLHRFSSFVLLIDAGVVYGAYILITHFNVEYEYILTNGDIDIDKIIAKKKEKKSFELFDERI
ncbi:MAG: DUF6106 family protein [Clostridiales bacterium]|nr:MAG: DUF6106 family protein [Clostridiales bacterium]